MRHKFIKSFLAVVCVLSMFFAFVGCNSANGKNESGNTFENIKANADYYDTWDGSIATSFKRGRGTVKNPYQISTGAELAYFAALVKDGNKDYNSAHYCLVNSIDLNGLEWMPIGFYKESWSGTRPNNTYNSFYGVFDGKSCLVRNYKITKKDSEEIGFFCDLNGGIIRNLGVAGNLSASSNATLTYRVGGLIGWNRGGIIENCFVAGDTAFTTHTGDCWVGGIAAHNSGTIRNCFVAGTVSARYRAQSFYGMENYKEALAGGIAAFNDGEISDCFFKGDAIAFSSNKSAISGGIAAHNDGGGKINNVYARGSVQADSYDLMAILEDRTVKTSCYAGGLVGNSYGAVSSSYSFAEVTANATEQINVGRLFGSFYKNALCFDVFYDVEKLLLYDYILFWDNVTTQLCDKGDAITESIILTTGFITSLNWDVDRWTVLDGKDPSLTELPDLFAVRFEGIEKTKMILDLDGNRMLKGYEAGTYEKEGYEFIGWLDTQTQTVVSDNKGIINLNEEITADMFLEPKLSPIKYVAEFYADGTLIDTVEFTVEYESLNEPTVPEKAGFTCSWEAYTIKAENLVINAKYIPIN